MDTPILQSGQVDTPEPVATPTPEPVVPSEPVVKEIVTDDRDTILGDLSSFLNPKPVEIPTPSPEPPPASPSAPEPTIAPETEALANRIAELEAQVVALDEYKKNPYQFVAKYLPAFAQEAFNPEEYVRTKLAEKYNFKDDFGNMTEFVPDPVKALRPGTPDYKYTMDLRRFEQEAQDILNSANSNIESIQQEAEVALESAKQSVMTKYGLTKDAFDQKIWSKLERIEKSRALELMADALMLEEKIATMKTNIDNGVNRTTIPSSVVDLGIPAPTGTDKELEELGKLFGKDYVNRKLAAINR